MDGKSSKEGSVKGGEWVGKEARRGSVKGGEVYGKSRKSKEGK